MSVVRLARRHAFQCLSPAGQNFSPLGPTHNYELEVYVEGEMRERDGMVLNIRELDRMIGEVIVPFTTKPLTVPSEVLAADLVPRIQRCMSSFNARLVKVRLIETPDLWFDVWV